ncbi:mannosyl-3-phosphoglycerate phosphatase [Tropicimonas sp. IMCC6043]|uniref:HAD-IIB family hydrolase n=1 Tax=Tropicimonas sp. IMCC6043 TaxID=2510645 RepID=UPI00101C8935|nr:HAD hydrolase family protein [Tropicimonas sp. IMCC6043]RYH07400.1 mannosyl-3-phosphoglycerate phosphatase [Tropicimonas sp. IMCC6043]
MGSPPLIVFTDLDGTLLDHATYSFAPARPALDRLAALEIPLILASSKTSVEIAEIQKKVGCTACPAIVENGAGILDPDPKATADAGTYVSLLAAINETSPYLRALFEGFHDLGPHGIAQATGLPPEEARLAGQRQFSEPGLFYGGPGELREFLRALGKLDIQGRRGGRFLTLSFGGTKADRMDEIAARYGNPPWLALGDAPNDVEMLEAADHAVIVANPHGAPLQPLPGEAAGLIHRTTRPGPEGWNAAVIDLLTKLNL